MKWELEENDSRRTIQVGHVEEIHRLKGDKGLVVVYSLDGGPYHVCCLKGIPGCCINVTLPGGKDLDAAKQIGLDKIEEWHKEYVGGLGRDPCPHDNEKWSDRAGIPDAFMTHLPRS